MMRYVVVLLVTSGCIREPQGAANDDFEGCTLTSSHPIPADDPGQVGLSAEALVAVLDQTELVVDFLPNEATDAVASVTLAFTLGVQLTSPVEEQVRERMDPSMLGCIVGTVSYATAEIALDGPDLSTNGPETGVVATADSVTWRGDTEHDWWVGASWDAVASEALVGELFPDCGAPQSAQFTLAIPDVEWLPWGDPALVLAGTCSGVFGQWGTEAYFRPFEPWSPEE